MKENKSITMDEVIENFKVLRLWHASACFIAVSLICCMIGTVVWGIFNFELRWLMISAGAVLGICGIVLYIVIHRTYIKTSSTILDYFRAAAKMSETEILEKARELKIPKKAIQNERGDT